MTSITNESQFEEYLKSSSEPLVIDFWADYCAPCKMLTPILEKVSNNMKNVRFAKVNVEHAGRITEKFGITSIPTLVFMKNETEVNRTTGSLSENKLQNIIKESFNL